MDIFEKIRQLTAFPNKTTQTSPGNAQKGLETINQIRSSLNIPITEFKSSVETASIAPKPIQPAFEPAFKPIQQQIKIAGQIPSPAPSVVKPIQLPPQKQDVERDALNYALRKGYFDNVSNIFGNLKSDFTKPIYDPEYEKNKNLSIIASAALYGNNPSKFYADTISRAYKEKLEPTMNLLNVFTDTIVQPVWKTAKIQIAKNNGIDINPDDAYKIVTGAKELNLPDVLKLDEKTTNPIAYTAVRFLDFAPNFIGLPGGEAGKTKALAKEKTTAPLKPFMLLTPAEAPTDVTVPTVTPPGVVPSPTYKILVSVA